MATSQEKTSKSEVKQSELKAEQALGLIGVGLMQKMSREGLSTLDWSAESNNERADLNSLKQRLELIALAIDTGAPLSTSEVSQLLGARPGASRTERGGLVATRISRNVWKLTRSEKDNNYWRN